MESAALAEEVTEAKRSAELAKRRRLETEVRVRCCRYQG